MLVPSTEVEKKKKGGLGIGSRVLTSDPNARTKREGAVNKKRICIAARLGT